MSHSCRQTSTCRANGQKHRATHNCSPLIFLWKEWSLLPRLFVRQSLQFLGGLDPLVFGKGVSIVGAPNQEQHNHIFSVADMLHLFSLQKFQKSTKALDKGLGFPQGHQSLGYFRRLVHVMHLINGCFWFP